MRAKVERMEIKSIVDSIVQGTYKYSSMQIAIETALACVSKTPTERPEISYVYYKLKECLKLRSLSNFSQMKSQVLLIPVLAFSLQFKCSPPLLFKGVGEVQRICLLTYPPLP